ncbi:MAG: hypothetical protein ACXWL2_03510 [Candidatus Chromulinivorax sp.]
MLTFKKILNFYTFLLFIQFCFIPEQLNASYRFAIKNYPTSPDNIDLIKNDIKKVKEIAIEDDFSLAELFPSDPENFNRSAIVIDRRDKKIAGYALKNDQNNEIVVFAAGLKYSSYQVGLMVAAYIQKNPTINRMDFSAENTRLDTALKIADFKHRGGPDEDNMQTAIKNPSSQPRIRRSNW